MRVDTGKNGVLELKADSGDVCATCEKLAKNDCPRTVEFIRKATPITQCSDYAKSLDNTEAEKLLKLDRKKLAIERSKFAFEREVLRSDQRCLRIEEQYLVQRMKTAATIEKAAETRAKLLEAQSQYGCFVVALKIIGAIFAIGLLFAIIS